MYVGEELRAGRQPGLSWAEVHTQHIHQTRAFLGHLGAPSVRPPTLGFGSGHSLRVVRWSPTWGCRLSAQPAEILSPSHSLPLCHPLPHMHVPTCTL